MIDARNIDYISVMEKVESLQNNIEEIKKNFGIAIFQDLFNWYELQSKELANVLEETNYKL